jgi:hypothetical protein
MRPITVSLTGTGVGPLVVLNRWASTDFFTVQVSNAGGFVYTVQTANLDPYENTALGPVYVSAGAYANSAVWSNTVVSGLTATNVTAQLPAAAAVRIIVPTTASGTIFMSVLQNGR